MDKGIKGRFYAVFILFFIIFILFFYIDKKMEQRFNEYYQILIDIKKNDNTLLISKKSFDLKDNNIAEDMCTPK